MADLERFFERLVRNLIAIDPARVKEPIPVMEIKTALLPYRTNRRSLALESVEEYEELLMRLCAEEGGFVVTTPPEVAEWCQRQMSSLAPDLSGIPGQATTTLVLNPAATMRVLGAGGGRTLEQAAASAADLPLPPDKCPYCEAPLPGNRAVNFCQTCGRSVILIPCDNCGADLEPGWRFCVNCGQDASEAGTPPG